MRASTVFGLVCVVLAVNTVVGGADEKEKDDDLRARRFAIMQKRVASATIQSESAGFPEQFSTKPIFKYSDPARGYVAAAVWKLGDKGRPKALIAVELDRTTYQKPCIGYELSSLTATPFSMKLDDVRWSPRETLYEFKSIPDAAAPEKTPTLRLIQMRKLAERFASREVDRSRKYELRLLSQPVDRYVPSNTEGADGAIFFFVFGTNPEVVLLIESDGKSWTYAAGRMTGAEEVVLTFDETTVWQGPPLKDGPTSPFIGSIAPIDIPGIAADGSEIKEDGK